MLLVWKMRQAIDFQKSRSLVQALMSQKDANDDLIKKVFTDLKEAFFPFDKNQKEAEYKKMRDQMQRWIQHGPVAIDVQDTGRPAKITSRLLKGQQAFIDRMKSEKQDKQRGTDPYKQATRRVRKS